MPVFVGISGAMIFRAAQQLERTLVDCALAYLAIQPRNCFRIVVENVRPGANNGLQRLPVSPEIRNQDLHLAARNPAANFCNRAGKDGRAAVGLVVAVDRSHHRVSQAHELRSFRHAFRLLLSGGAAGLPDGTAQNPQARVQIFPRIMNVAVRCSQHSPMLGQRALSQTVLRPSVRMMRFKSW